MSTHNGPVVAVVIPAYDEARTIRDLVERARRLLARIVVVDDGSTDDTSGSLAGLPVTVLRNASNRGKAESLRRGIGHALESGATAVITLDGDGQHLPEDIPRFVAMHEAHPDAIVIGARQRSRAEAPLVRYCANRFANFWVAWAAGQPMADSQSGFRLYPAAVLRRLDVLENRAVGFVFESEILIDAGRSGVRNVALPIAAIYPDDGRRSHLRPVTDILAITRMVAWKLVSRGLYLQGLVNSLRRDPAGVDPGDFEPGCTTRSTRD